jgi:hypothetical protein
MTLFWVSYAFEGASTQTFYRLLAWCQGIAPFVLFSLTVHNEREGRRVLMLWVLAYGLHGMITVLDTAVSGSGLSLVAVARLRTEESAGNANALGWVGLLYLPLSIGLALAATRRWKRWVWWGAFVGITLLLIFGFSRAAMFGMFMTFGLAVLILPSRKERLMMTFLLLVASGGLILSWKVAATHVVGSSRSLTRRSVEDSYAEVSQRLESMWLGWQIFSRNLWFGTGFRSDLPGTHSYFVKIAMEFGIIYLVFSIVLFVYLLRVSFKVARLSQVKQVRNLAWSIFIAGIVAIPESCFGITLTTAGYIQVFWLLLAYLELANREVARQFVQQHQYQRRHFA